MAEELCLYNQKSGSGLATPENLQKLGIEHAISFFDFLQNPSFYLAGLESCIIAGGDGTFFSFLQLVAQLSAQEKISLQQLRMLPLPLGSENIASRTVQVTGKQEQLQTLVRQFRENTLSYSVIKPFAFSQGDEQEDKYGFWSVCTGAFSPVILEFLARERQIQDPTQRKLKAALYAIQARWFASVTAANPEERVTSGRDIIFLKNNFPYWSRYLKVTRFGVQHVTQDFDYVMRIGKPQQGKAEAFAGLVIDLCIAHIFPHVWSLWDGHTLETVPVHQNVVLDNEQATNFIVDSEIEKSRHPQIKINRTRLPKQPEYQIARWSEK